MELHLTPLSTCATESRGSASMLGGWGNEGAGRDAQSSSLCPGEDTHPSHRRRQQVEAGLCPGTHCGLAELFHPHPVCHPPCTGPGTG